MATRAEQEAEIARLAEALAARTEELAETLAALTVMRAVYASGGRGRSAGRDRPRRHPRRYPAADR
jgi:hypothetical protein